MATVRARRLVSAPVERVFAFLDDPRNLAAMVPPPLRVAVVRAEPWPLKPGSEIELSYGIGRWRRRWLLRVAEREENGRIVDDSLAGPFTRFRFEHRLRPARGGRATWLEDTVELHVGPGGLVGGLLDAVVALGVRASFVYRRAVERRILAR